MNEELISWPLCSHCEPLHTKQNLPAVFHNERVTRAAKAYFFINYKTKKQWVKIRF